MRITSRFSCAANEGFMSLPALAHDPSHYFPDDRFDRSRFMKDLSGRKEFTMSSEDDDAAFMFAIEFLSRIREMLKRFTNESCGVREAVAGEPKTHAERRFERGRFTYVRVDVRHRPSDGSFRVRLDASNPKEVPGPTEEFARLVAQAYADNLVELRDELAKDGVATDLVEGENCAGMFARSEDRNRRLRLLEEHEVCANRVCGMCSPSNFNCELFANGRCRYAELASTRKE